MPGGLGMPRRVLQYLKGKEKRVFLEAIGR